MKIKGIARTRQVFLNGAEVSSKKSQGYINLSQRGFGWGDTSPASKQLALAILLEHYSVPIAAIEDYEDFCQRFIAPLKRTQTLKRKFTDGNRSLSTDKLVRQKPEVLKILT